MASSFLSTLGLLRLMGKNLKRLHLANYATPTCTSMHFSNKNQTFKQTSNKMYFPDLDFTFNLIIFKPYKVKMMIEFFIQTRKKKDFRIYSNIIIHLFNIFSDYPFVFEKT